MSAGRDISGGLRGSSDLVLVVLSATHDFKNMIDCQKEENLLLNFWYIDALMLNASKISGVEYP